MEEGFGNCVDLLTEVEEVSSLFHGKVTEIDYSNPCFGDTEGGGAPSLGLPDGLLAPALFGDPLLPLPMLDQDLSPFLLPASPQPETLMQVSLTAGQPPAPSLRPSSPATPSPTEEEQTAAPSSHSPRHSSPVTPPSTPEHQISAPSSSEDQPAAPRPPSPVRVVVRTNMVAPVNLEKSSRFLVRIPRSLPPPTARVTRHRVLRAGGKLGAAAAAAASKPAEAPRPQAPTTPESAVSTTTTTTCIPFRSLAGGVHGRTRHSSTSSNGGTKRKAYELGPQKDPAMERCRQNAINARRNRELKKAQMAELERRAAEADEERQRLAEENRRLREDNSRLQREVGHLTGVIQNQSRLSHILEKVSPARLTLGDAGPPGKEEEEEGAGVSRGVCLHLDGDEATLECCAVCAKKAGRRLRHTTQSAAPVAVFSTCDQL